MNQDHLHPLTTILPPIWSWLPNWWALIQVEVLARILCLREKQQRWHPIHIRADLGEMWPFCNGAEFRTMAAVEGCLSRFQDAETPQESLVRTDQKQEMGKTCKGGDQGSLPLYNLFNKPFAGVKRICPLFYLHRMGKALVRSPYQTCCNSIVHQIQDGPP